MQGAEAPATPAADAAVFAEGLWADLPAPAADDTLLLRGVPGAGAPVEGVEGAATLPSVPERPAEAAGPEPPLPGAPEGTTSARKRCRHRCEGHPYEIFFRAAATARDAMWSLITPGGRRCNAFVLTFAATL